VLLVLMLESERLTWPLLAALGFLAVCATVVFSVAAPALLPALVPARLLPLANARIELARTTAFAAGPALGGALVGWAGAATAFGVAAALSVAAAGLLIGPREPQRTPPTERRPLQEIKDGALFVWHHALLWPVFVTQFVFNTALFVILAVFVPHAVHNLGLAASAVGFTLGLFGVGMVVGALLAPEIMRRLKFGDVVLLGPFAGLLGSILIGLTIWLPQPSLAGFGFFLLGVGPILWVISTTTLRQSVTPANLLARVSAINIMAYGARPLGSALAALIGGHYGIYPCLLVATVGFLAQAVIIARSPLVNLERQPEMA
jgi:predicted MFS family arabinose efflux permease